MRQHLIFLYLIILCSLFSCKNDLKRDNSQNNDTEMINFMSDYPTINADSTVNAVIEIPAGSIQKWQVNKGTGQLEHEIKNGKKRNVNYLGYPANYGMIPQTKLPKAQGGDGDPLDVIVLGESIHRGEVVPVRIIGVLNLLDGGEQDDKLIAVSAHSHFADIDNIADLDEQYNGITEILKIWFINYKGQGILESTGYSSKEKAWQILQYSIEGYKNQ